MRKLFFFFLLFGLLFSAVYWSSNIAGGKKLKADKHYLVISTTGAFLVDKNTGNVVFQKKSPFKDGVEVAEGVVLVEDGDLYFYDLSGRVVWNLSIKNLTNVEKGKNILIAIGDEGVYGISKEGKIVWEFLENSTKSSAVVKEGLIAFFSNTKLVVMDEKGKILFTREVGEWWGLPEIKNGYIYVPAANRLIAFNINGEIVWERFFPFHVFSPLAYGNIIAVASGNTAYILDISDGSVYWRISLPSVVFKRPSVYVEGGKVYVIFYGNEGAYVVLAKTGEVVNEISEEVVDGTENAFLTLKRLYSFNPVRGCYIEVEKEIVGYKDVEIEITAKSGVPFIRINKGNWEEAESIDGKWSYFLSPTRYNFGEIVVECRIRDSLGEENPPYRKRILYRSPNLEKGKFIVSYPQKVQLGSRVKFSVSDDEGRVVRDYIVEFEGKKMRVSGNFTLKMRAPGEKTVVLTKEGFERKEINIYVEGPPTVFLLVLAFFLLLGGLIRLYGIRGVKNIIHSLVSNFAKKMIER